MANAVLISGARILDPSRGIDEVRDLLLSEGLILTESKERPEGSSVIHAQGLIACPGFIDLHCHLREPGYEHKETIHSGTQAAARGGFTTLCCMPNTLPPIDSAAVVEWIQKKAAAEGTVRVHPVGCISKGRQGKELAEMEELAAAGIVAFSDDGSPVQDPQLMRLALAYGRDLGLPITEHCQDLHLSGAGVAHEGLVSMRLGLQGIPSAAEEAMAARDISLAKLTGGRLHLAHVSTTGTVELVRRAKASGVRVTAEVCPHHLTITDRWIMGREGTGPADGTKYHYDTNTKVYPPLREQRDVKACVQGLADGTIDCVATDHAPHDFASKMVTYEEAEFGISVLETALGSLLGLVHKGLLDMTTMVDRLTSGPARVLGQDFQRFATLEPGTPADIVIFDPDLEWVVDPDEFASKGKNTPLGGTTLRGKVVATIVGGEIVFMDPPLRAQL